MEEPRFVEDELELTEDEAEDVETESTEHGLKAGVQDDGRVKVVDGEGDERLFGHQTDPVRELHFSSDGRYLISVSTSGRLLLRSIARMAYDLHP